MTAELAEGKGGARAEVLGAIEATCNGQICPRAALDTPHDQSLPSGHVHRRVHRHGLAIQTQWNSRPRHHNAGRCTELQGRPLQGDFQCRRVRHVAQHGISEPEGIIVEGPRGRHADIPVAAATGEILNGGLGTALQHIDTRRLPSYLCKIAGCDVALRHHSVIQQVTQIGTVAFDAVQLRLIQRLPQTLNCGVAVLPSVKDFCQHRIEVR